jgi:DNA invertase Pin-like site-specific DNA recombinase
VNVIGYMRVSTDDQADSGLGLDAQRDAITAEADRRGWTVQWVEDAGYSAKSLKRPGIASALDALKSGEAQALVVAKLDRLSRSVVDFANTLGTAKREGWAVVLLDLGVDTLTPNGKLIAGLMAQIAEWEREIIGARTKEALAAARARGQRLGRPREIEPKLLARIVKMRSRGQSLRHIARTLNDTGVPTVRGGRCWHPATVRGLLQSAALGVETSISAHEGVA